MKPPHFLTSLLALTFVSCAAWAQERETDIYRLERDTPLYPCEITGKPLDETLAFYETAPEGCKVQKLRTKTIDEKEYYVIKVLLYRKESSYYDKLNNAEFIYRKLEQKYSSLDKGSLRKITDYDKSYFLIESSELSDQNKVYSKSSFWKPDFTYGVITIPFKLRNGPFDVSKEVNLGTSIGARWYSSRKNPNRSIDGVIGLGLTSVAIDSLSTDGRITDSESLSTFSVYGGIVFEFSVIQVGAFLGWDHALRGNENNWRYHGKPWVGLGIGTAVFSRNKVAKSDETGNSDDKPKPEDSK